MSDKESNKEGGDDSDCLSALYKSCFICGTSTPPSFKQHICADCTKKRKRDDSDDDDDDSQVVSKPRFAVTPAVKHVAVIYSVNRCRRMVIELDGISDERYDVIKTMCAESRFSFSACGGAPSNVTEDTSESDILAYKILVDCDVSIRSGKLDNYTPPEGTVISMVGFVLI